jgi:hypothetical protein
MKQKIIVVVLCFTVLSLVSCQTIMQEHPGAAVGTGAGAATGAVAGALIGKGAGAVILGGLLGGLAGGLIGHYAYDVPRSREETARVYRYHPSEGTILTIENATVYPHAVYPGEVVDLKVTYAVLTPSPDAEVDITEIREITHHGELVGNPEIRVIRPGGTYSSIVPLHLPPNARRGEYRVKTIVESSSAKDTREIYFTVK